MEPNPARGLAVTDPERTLGEARQRAADAVVRVRQSVDAVELEVQHTLDWRHHVRASPHLWVAGAFFLGFLVGDRAHS